MNDATDRDSPRIFTARWVLPVSASPILRGAVAVRDGRIDFVGRESDLPEACRRDASGLDVGRMDLGDAALLPGFVNVHAHLDLTVLRGCDDGVDFFRWIRGLVAAKEARLDPRTAELSARWGCLEALRGGVSTLADVSDRPAGFDGMRACGLRGIAYREVFGPADADAKPTFERFRAEVEEARAGDTKLVRTGISPHSPYSVSASLYRRLGAYARDESLPLTIHVAESDAETRFVAAGEGPFADFHRGRGIAVSSRGQSPIAYLRSLGVLQARPLLIHAVRADEEDLSSVLDAGASIAHCPKSNAKLAHGTAPLDRFLALGIPTGLGTDGAVANDGCDLLEEARFAALILRARGPDSGGAFDARAILRLLTLGGAEALGLAGEVGSLERGKQADLTAVDLSRPGIFPATDPEAAVAWCAQRADVLLTVVAGKLLHAGGSFPGTNAKDLARELSQRLGAEI